MMNNRKCCRRLYGFTPAELHRIFTIFHTVPAGICIATDVSCKEIIHNPVSAEIFRIKPWNSLSCSGDRKLPLKIFHRGKELLPEEMPVQRAAWYGEHVNNMELELVWDDGVAKQIVMNSRPLYNDGGHIVGAIATLNDVTKERKLEKELVQHRDNLEELVRERTRELEAANLRLIKENQRRREAEAKLEKKNRQINDILESITDAFFALDEQWRFTYLNREALRQFAKTGEQLLGKHITEVFPGSAEILQKFREAVREQKAVHFETYSPNLGKWFDVHAYPAKSGLSVYFHDLTERKKIEREMVRLDRLNLIGEMAAGIGHEIRNPITTVRGFLQLLAGKDEFVEKKGYFDLMISELDRANSIISEFLSLAKNKTVKLRVQNLNTIIRNISALLQADAAACEKSVAIHLGQIPDLPLDEKEISQLIINLVRNGLDAVPSGGEVKIRTYADESGVVLAVEDNGQGIDTEIFDKIGTPFFTTKDNGTGLGLAVCYSTASRHNAKIEINTGPSGTTVLARFNKYENKE